MQHKHDWETIFLNGIKATHKEIKELHIMEVSAHTLLINGVDEVYAQVPSTTEYILDLPATHKLTKVNERV
jgi:hypothetical protein